MGSVKDAAVLQILRMCYILLCRFVKPRNSFLTVPFSTLTLFPSYQTLLSFNVLFDKKKNLSNTWSLIIHPTNSH